MSVDLFSIAMEEITILRLPKRGLACWDCCCSAGILLGVFARSWWLLFGVTACD